MRGVHTHFYTEVKNDSGAPPELSWGGGHGQRPRGGSGGASLRGAGSVVGRVRRGSGLGSDSRAHGGPWLNVRSLGGPLGSWPVCG